MAIKVADNFLYQGRKPLDNRIIIDTISDMVSMAPAIIYDGMIVYIKDTKEFYVYDSTNTEDAVLSKWRLLNTGSGSTSLKEYVQNTDYKKDDLVYLDEKIARVVTNYTSDNTETSIEDSFKLDITNNNLVLISASNMNSMPIAPDTKELRIKNGGVGYTIGDIIETTTTGVFAEVSNIGTSGLITEVTLSTATTRSTTGTGAIIDYAQVVYGGYGENWAALSEAAVLVAQVLADKFDYEQGYSFEITAPGAGYAVGDVIPTSIAGVNVRVTSVGTSGDILSVQYCRQLNVSMSGTNGTITASVDNNVFIVPEQYWNAGLSLFDITNDDGANVQFYRTGDSLIKYSVGANNKIYEFVFDEVNGIITQKFIEVSGSGASMKAYKTLSLLAKIIENITIINISDIEPITQITDIQLNQLVYDEDGTVGNVVSVDNTTGKIEVQTITLSGSGNEYMPLAPDTKGLKIKVTGSGYTTGDIIETTTSGIFAEITGVDSLGAITDVSLSTATSSTTTNATGVISYEQIVYGGYNNNWAPLVDAAVLNAKISADMSNYDTGYDYTITDGGSGYTVGDIVSTDILDVNIEVVAVNNDGAITSVKFTRKATISTSGTGSIINATVNPDIQVIPNDLWNGGVSIFSLTNDDGATVEFYRTGDVTTKYGIGAGNKLYKFEYDEIDGIIKQSSSIISGIAQISNKSDNAIEEITSSTDQNEDGLYVKDLQPQIDSIKKYQKYLNTELDYCYARLSTSIPKTTINALDIIPFEKVSGSLEMNANAVKLLAGKTYELDADLRVVEGEALFAFYDETNNESLGQFAETIETANGTEVSGKVIVTPDTDIEVSIKCVYEYSEGNPTLAAGSASYSYCYFIAKEINRQIVIDPVEYVNTNNGIEDTPVGHIISTMSNTAPKHYLICDGTVYNITDYPFLADHFKTEFGSYNYFGGDGTNTFAVPDLRGEFLRGTGTNSHTDQGNGADVGEHQDATNNLNFYIGATSEIWIDSNSSKTVQNADSKNTFDTSIARRTFYRKDNVSDDNIEYGDNGTYYTSRPTNTSVLYCIKYEPTHFMYLNGYEEVKELINTTYEYATPASSGTTVYTDTISLSESIESFDKLEFVIDIRSADSREFYKKVDIFRVSDIVYTTSGIVGENTYQAEIHTITSEGTWIANICFNFRDNSTIDIVRVGVSSPIDTSAPWDFIKIHNIRGIRNSTTQSTNSNDSAKLNTYSTIITGNDTDNTFTINHNLDTLKLSTSVYDTTTLEEVAYELKRIDKNTVQISWGDAIPTGTEYQVDILGW